MFRDVHSVFLLSHPTLLIVSLFSMYTEIPTTKDLISEAIRTGACPCGHSLSMCPRRSLSQSQSQSLLVLQHELVMFLVGYTHI